MPTKLSFSAMLFSALLPVFAACNNGPTVSTVSSEQKASEQPAAAPVAPPKLPCPVKLTNSRMVHNSEMDVYTTVTNISKSDITAIALGAAHTSKFGEMLEPYKTDLTSEDTIRRGHSQSMHWEVLMEEPTGIRNSRPGSSELFVDKVAFSDGRIFRLGDFESCDFKF